MNKKGLETLLRKKNTIGKLLCLLVILTAVGCQPNVPQTSVATKPQTLRDVPSLRLNYRFETDVPAPTINVPLQSDERNAAVQADFDQSRPQEQVDKMLTSPDKLRVLTVYHKSGDAEGDFRLDMYSNDGKLLRNISFQGMAVHYPDTIVWSPDSANAAFMAKTRSIQPNGTAPNPVAAPIEKQANSNSAVNNNTNIENANSSLNSNSADNANAVVQTPATEAPKAVLTFRTEQIYLTNREGADVKPLTQNEGLIYFYFVWSPDGSALAAMAVTFQEWNYLQYQAETKGEFFTPAGRPRLVEKTGRERRLDDNLTNVRPVWSPDSAKVAVAFGTQARIYDAIGDAPTQAAIPLINQLKISSKVFDENIAKQEQSTANGNTNTGININADTNANINPTATVNQDTTTLPDESSLVSFNPIISLEWTEDSMLYLQTGFIKQLKDETNSARSFLRWHRLISSPQPAALGN